MSNLNSDIPQNPNGNQGEEEEQMNNNKHRDDKYDNNNEEQDQQPPQQNQQPPQQNQENQQQQFNDNNGNGNNNNIQNQQAPQPNQQAPQPNQQPPQPNQNQDNNENKEEKNDDNNENIPNHTLDDVIGQLYNSSEGIQYIVSDTREEHCARLILRKHKAGKNEKVESFGVIFDSVKAFSLFVGSGNQWCSWARANLLGANKILYSWTNIDKLNGGLRGGRLLVDTLRFTAEDIILFPTKISLGETLLNMGTKPNDSATGLFIEAYDSAIKYEIDMNKFSEYVNNNLRQVAPIYDNSDDTMPEIAPAVYQNPIGPVYQPQPIQPPNPNPPPPIQPPNPNPPQPIQQQQQNPNPPQPPNLQEQNNNTEQQLIALRAQLQLQITRCNQKDTLIAQKDDIINELNEQLEKEKKEKKAILLASLKATRTGAILKAENEKLKNEVNELKNNNNNDINIINNNNNYSLSRKLTTSNTTSPKPTKRDRSETIEGSETPPPNLVISSVKQIHHQRKIALQQELEKKEELDKNSNDNSNKKHGEKIELITRMTDSVEPNNNNNDNNNKIMLPSELNLQARSKFFRDIRKYIVYTNGCIDVAETMKVLEKYYHNVKILHVIGFAHRNKKKCINVSYKFLGIQAMQILNQKTDRVLFTDFKRELQKKFAAIKINEGAWQRIKARVTRHNNKFLD